MCFHTENFIMATVKPFHDLLVRKCNVMPCKRVNKMLIAKIKYMISSSGTLTCTYEAQACSFFQNTWVGQNVYDRGQEDTKR